MIRWWCGKAGNQVNPTLTLILSLRERKAIFGGHNSKCNVIPAEAGIQNEGKGLDSHLRGNDGELEGFSSEREQ